MDPTGPNLSHVEYHNCSRGEGFSKCFLPTGTLGKLTKGVLAIRAIILRVLCLFTKLWDESSGILNGLPEDMVFSRAWCTTGSMSRGKPCGSLGTFISEKIPMSSLRSGCASGFLNACMLKGTRAVSLTFFVILAHAWERGLVTSMWNCLELSVVELVFPVAFG